METLEGWLSDLRASDRQIIVEGKKDRRALRMLGIPDSRISDIKGPLFSFVEGVSKRHKEVILLTDLDAEGRRLYGRLNTDFQKMGIKVDKSFREFLFRMKISHIEGLDTYFAKNL